MNQVIDLVGQHFGELKVLRRAGSSKTCGFAVWECECSCGNTTTVTSANLRQGITKSCGHLRVEVTKKLKTKHGHRSREKGQRRSTPEYDAWCDMKKRCYNPNYDGFENYGGRGIRVRYVKWRKSFPVFFADIGHRPSYKHSLDRIDNDGHYEPGNVRWATAKQQARNRRPRSR
jgi:hypothetical protein